MVPKVWVLETIDMASASHSKYDFYTGLCFGANMHWPLAVFLWGYQDEPMTVRLAWWEAGWLAMPPDMWPFHHDLI